MNLAELIENNIGTVQSAVPITKEDYMLYDVIIIGKGPARYICKSLHIKSKQKDIDYRKR